ncbi:hypothetical protein JTE90_020153 [Oedothorax gibbosus]|uniref:Uncharacterized protein n=1 Tax=Oedothorax gibbosus TaxID=931172 RepID=A0AAV6TSJ6_9ARAC|nr:hypothetical protein JTE90_020153 [Oedothorax gibbosus]
MYPNYDEKDTLSDSRELTTQLPAEQFDVESGIEELSKPRKGKKSKKRRKKNNKNRFLLLNNKQQGDKKQDLVNDKKELSFRNAPEQNHGTHCGVETTRSEDSLPTPGLPENPSITGNITGLITGQISK